MATISTIQYEAILFQHFLQVPKGNIFGIIADTLQSLGTSAH